MDKKELIKPLGKPKPERIEKPKKRKKISERKRLERELDALCRAIVVDRDVNCVCPPPQHGHFGSLAAGHLITRCKMSIRWDLMNLHAQCVSCNGRHEHFAHYYTNWFLGKFGAEEYARLCKDGESIAKMQLYELAELLEQLKKIRQKQIIENLAGNSWKPYFSQSQILSGAWSK